MADGSERVRVLLVIEQCNPEWPSVPLVGYQFYRHIAELADVTLITHARNERALRARHPGADLVVVAESAILALWHKIATRLSTIGRSTIWPLYHTLTYPTYAEFDRKVLRLLGRRILRGEFDVVHVITPMMPRYPYSVRKVCGSTPLIIGPVNGGVHYPASFAKVAKSEFSFLNWLRTAGRHLLAGYRETYETADYVYSGSQHTKELLESLFKLKREVVVLAENGLEATFFSNAPFEKARETLEILFVGRLVPYKCADIAIDALASLPPALQTRARLTIVGDGPERAALEARAQTAGVAPMVRFPGWVSQQGTLTYYRSADVFCFPSIREFGGAVVLEAMANSLPCIVVNNGGVAEYVTEAAGFKIEPLSREHVVSQVALALQRFIEEPRLRQSMGMSARARARHYAWPGKAQSIVATYRALLAERGDSCQPSREPVA